jgi:hypothetical protein
LFDDIVLMDLKCGMFPGDPGKKYIIPFLMLVDKDHPDQFVVDLGDFEVDPADRAIKVNDLA